MMRVRRFFELLPLLPVLALSFTLTAAADESLEAGGGVRIEDATATPAPRSAYSSLRFRLVNDSTATFHILGIESPLASNARLVARLGTEDATVLESIGVPPDEALDLTTSHLHYEVGPLERALAEGETVEMTLRFVGGELSFPVHVHRSNR